jgi:hypothetical protein
MIPPHQSSPFLTGNLDLAVLVVKSKTYLSVRSLVEPSIIVDVESNITVYQFRPSEVAAFHLFGL